MTWRLRMFGFQVLSFFFHTINDCETISIMLFEVSYLVSLLLNFSDYIFFTQITFTAFVWRITFFFDSFSVLADGLGNKISEDGVAYYNSLIDFLLEKGHYL